MGGGAVKGLSLGRLGWKTLVGAKAAQKLDMMETYQMSFNSPFNAIVSCGFKNKKQEANVNSH